MDEVVVDVDKRQLVASVVLVVVNETVHDDSAVLTVTLIMVLTSYLESVVTTVVDSVANKQSVAVTVVVTLVVVVHVGAGVLTV